MTPQELAALNRLEIAERTHPLPLLDAYPRLRCVPRWDCDTLPLLIHYAQQEPRRTPSYQPRDPQNS